MAALCARAERWVAVPDERAENGRAIARKLGNVEALPAPPLFSSVELLVIGIGKRDRATFVKRGSRLAYLQRLLFGIEAPKPFADARLEALRSLAVALRRHERPEVELAAAAAAGVTPQQIEHLRSSR